MGAIRIPQSVLKQLSAAQVVEPPHKTDYDLHNFAKLIMQSRGFSAQPSDWLKDACFYKNLAEY